MRQLSQYNIPPPYIKVTLHDQGHAVSLRFDDGRTESNQFSVSIYATLSYISKPIEQQRGGFKGQRVRLLWSSLRGLTFR